jgi:hypothetical protein
MDPSPQRERDEGKSCHPSARYISLLAARRGRPGSGRSSIVGECDLSCNLAASQVPGCRKGGGAQEYGTSTLHAHEIDLERGISNSMTFEYYSVSGLLLFSPPSSSSIPCSRTVPFLLFLHPPFCLPLRVIRRPQLLLWYSRSSLRSKHVLFSAPLCVPSASNPR